ncbi:Os06g0608550, partial [Oryza sativa Japonica Group]
REIPNYIAISACKAANSSSSVLLLWAEGRVGCCTRTGAVGAVVVGARSSASNSSPSRSANSASSSSYQKQHILLQ